MELNDGILREVNGISMISTWIYLLGELQVTNKALILLSYNIQLACDMVFTHKIDSNIDLIASG